jgi:2-dehydro-3-deoxygalactonokinase
VKHVPAGKRKRALICPGLTCRDRQHIPDVMRGEEVQIFGALSIHSEVSNANVCLPGTHSKHAFIRGSQIERFVTHMTGEVFGLLRDHSILGRPMTKRQASLDAFDAGLRRARQPGGLLHHVFGVRTLVLMNDLDAAHLTDYLSGILIGHELASAAPDLPALFIGDPALCALYQRGVTGFGAHADVLPADIATARGLYAIGSLLAEEAQ